MRTDAFKRDVDVSEALPTTAFTIQANAKMFGILADRLYSNKPRAVIREIACNALDAHGMNGQTKPFIISLPNGMEPMLTIRDFGPSMTHHDVMNNYTSFGVSTKDQSDDAVGGFGLGCKAPFCYADAFTVSAFQAGEKRNYAAYRGPDGIPQMTFVGAEPSDEPEGIEVRVPVKEADFYTFITTAEDLLKHFPEGSFELHGGGVDMIEYQSKEQSYWVRTVAPAKPYVLMGPVAYPLDWSLVLEGDDARLPEPIVMVFDIGALDLLPSREGLSYDKTTIQALRDRYKLIGDQFAEAQYELVQKLNRFEQLKFIEQLRKNSTWNLIVKRWPQVMEKRDPDDKSVKPLKVLQEAGFPGITDYIELKGRPELVSVSPKSRRSSQLEVNARRGGLEGATSTRFHHKHLGQLTAFVFDDMVGEKDSKRRAQARFKQLVSDWGVNEIDVVFFDASQRTNPIKDADGVWQDPVWGITGGWASVDELRSALAEWEFVDQNVFNLSELDLPAPKVSASRASSGKKTELRVLTTKKNTWQRRNWYRSSNPWHDPGITYSSGVYVPLSNYDLDGFDEKWLSHEFLGEMTILGLSKKALKQIKADGNMGDFERLDDWCIRMVKEAQADPEVQAEFARREFVSQMRSDRIVKGVMSICRGAPGAFPAVNQAMLGLEVPGDPALLSRVDALRDYCSRNIVKPPKAKIKSSVAREAKKAYNSSPLLRLAVRVMEQHRFNLLVLDDDNVMSLINVKKKVTTTDE